MAGMFDDILNAPDSPEQEQQTKEKFAKIQDEQQRLQSQPKNMFSDIVNAPEPGDPIEQPKQQEKMSPAMAAIVQFNHAFDRFGEGIAQGLNFFIGNENLDKKIDLLHQERQKQYNEANQVNDGWGGTAAGLVGEVGAGVVKYGALPFGAMTSLAAKIGAGAVAGAAGAGVDYAKNSDERLQNMAYGGVAGGATAGALDLGGKLISNIFAPKDGISKYVNRLLFPEKAATNEVAKIAEAQLKKDFPNMAPSEAVKQTVKAADDAGVSLSPAQAIGGDIADLTNLEKTAKINPLSYQEAKTAALNTEETIKRKVADTIKGIAGDQTDDTIKAAYKGLETTKVPTEVVDSLSQNKTISKVLGDVDQIKQYEPDSLARFNDAKVMIDKKLKWYDNPDNSGGMLSKGPSNEVIKQDLLTARKELVGQLDEAVPEYADVRKQFMQKEISDKYMKILEKTRDSKKVAGMEAETPVAMINRKLFGSTDLKKRFLADVEKTGGNVQQAEDTIQLIRQIQISPLKDVLAGTAKDTTNIHGGLFNFAKETLKKIGTDGYKKALFEMMFNNNKWADDVAEVLKHSDRDDKIRAFLGLLKKVGTTRAAVVAGSAAANEKNDMNQVPEGFMQLE